MLFFTLRQADFHFDFAARKVQIQRNDGVTRALGFTDELVDFGLLEQKLARTDGVGFDVCRGSRQRGNMAADQIKSVFFPVDIGAEIGRASCRERV